MYWWEQPSPKTILMEQLVRKTEALRRQVTFEEVQQDTTMPAPNDYAYYWGSFTEAAKTAWSKVRVELAKIKKEADFEMANLSNAERKWLAWILEVGKGSLPGWVELKKAYPAEAEKILKVFGYWNTVERLYAEGKRSGTLEEMTKLEPEDTGTATAGAEVSVGASAEAREAAGTEENTAAEGRKGRKLTSGLTEVEAVKIILRIQRDLALDRLPSQTEINAYSKQYQTASYATIAKRLGPKDQWPEVVARLKDAVQDEAAAMDAKDVTVVVTGAGGQTQAQPGDGNDVVAPADAGEAIAGEAEVPEVSAEKTDLTLLEWWRNTEDLARKLGGEAVNLWSVQMTVAQNEDKFAVKIHRIE